MTKSGEGEFVEGWMPFLKFVLLMSVVFGL